VKSANPKNIDVSLSSGVTIDWSDAHRSLYTLEYLREKCPCASCTSGTHLKGSSPSAFQMYKKVLKMEGVEPVGRYALQFKWNDGHSSGIYSFEHLRDICPCDQCRSEKS
jgi:DUF971 family protein